MRISVAPHFLISACLRVPARSKLEQRVGATIRSLEGGPSADDLPFLLPPVRHARCRRVPSSNLVVVYVELANEMRAVAVAEAPDSCTDGDVD